MKFYIQRQTRAFSEDSEPCRDAFPTIHEETGTLMWWVEVKDLDHLMRIQREVGCQLAVDRHWITILD